VAAVSEESKRRILNEHYLIERKVNWTDGDGEDRQTYEEVCVVCVPKYSHIDKATDLGPCKTVRALGLPFARDAGLMTGWEAGMAQRARERTRRADAAEYAAWRAEADRETRAEMAGMTLGEAVGLLRWERDNGPTACACVGPPSCCVDVYRQAEALSRAAHIVVELVSRGV
jgi:hypothetical protein